MDVRGSDVQQYIVATLYDYHQGLPIATISLNGKTIRPGGPLHERGSMRSFKLTNGDLGELRTYWRDQQLMILRMRGTDMSIRISALPVEAHGFGFIEFVAVMNSGT